MTRSVPRQPRILIVDDDRSVRDATVDFLMANGMSAIALADAEQADTSIRTTSFDAVVLDVMLPGEDGLSLCRRLAERGPPIVMVSAMGSTIDRIVGIELGAADYLGKPFEPRELLARLRSVIRQRRHRAVAPASDPTVDFGGLRFDPGAAKLSKALGGHVALTAGELTLLAAFVDRHGRLLTREMLIDLTHGGAEGPFDRAVDLAVSRLRRRLREAGAGECIETVRGAGYRFVATITRS